MPKKLENEFAQITFICRNFGQYFSLNQLLQYMPKELSKRTLQYRLQQMVKIGTLFTKGRGKNSKYCLAAPLLLMAGESPRHYSILPLSVEALKVKESVSLPIPLRKPVTYKHSFLEAYEPNKTFYLTESMLEKLHQLGAGAERGRPAGTYAKKIFQRLLIDLSWNSSRLEGNTYSLLETEKLLATGEALPGKHVAETQMIVNHKDAIEYLVSMSEDININSYTILNLHGLLAHNLLNSTACGRLRVIPVRIGKSVYLPPEIPQVIEDGFRTIVQKAAAILNPYEQSFFLMVHLPYLQPFQDVNKRVSRLAGNIPLIRENLSPISFVDVPEEEYIQGLLAVYELNRIELFRDVFVWAYERSALQYLHTL